MNDQELTRAICRSARNVGLVPSEYGIQEPPSDIQVWQNHFEQRVAKSKARTKKAKRMVDLHLHVGVGMTMGYYYVASGISYAFALASLVAAYGISAILADTQAKLFKGR